MKTIKILGIILQNLFCGELSLLYCFSFNGNILTCKIFQMKIGSVLENQNLEKRIAITPDIVKKYISLGFEISLVKIMVHI